MLALARERERLYTTPTYSFIKRYTVITVVCYTRINFVQSNTFIYNLYRKSRWLKITDFTIFYYNLYFKTMVHFLHIKEWREYVIDIAKNDLFLIILSITQIRRYMYFLNHPVSDAYYARVVWSFS